MLEVSRRNAAEVAMVTIKDIARRAGVSFSTVSKALQNSPLVRPSTKQRVLAIAKEMGYEPNLAARSLVSRKTGAIGAVWPSIERGALSALLTELHGRLESEGWTMLLSMSRPETAIQTFRRFRLDAVLMFGDRDLDEARIAEIRRLQIPVLVYGAAGRAPFSTVDVNRGNAVRLAIDHLAELGHRQIAYIGEPRTPDPLQTVKIDAFFGEMARRGLPCGGESVVPLDGLDFHDGYWAARSLLQRDDPPTAVVTGGIDLTRGLLRAVRDLGRSVPDDLSVVSYDNLPQMEDLEVPMTAVGAPVSEIAAAIARTIRELVGGPDTIRTVYLEPELIVRKSTAKAGRAR